MNTTIPAIWRTWRVPLLVAATVEIALLTLIAATEVTACFGTCAEQDNDAWFLIYSVLQLPTSLLVIFVLSRFEISGWISHAQAVWVYFSVLFLGQTWFMAFFLRRRAAMVNRNAV
jgi:hypothetical protein